MHVLLKPGQLKVANLRHQLMLIAIKHTHQGLPDEISHSCNCLLSHLYPPTIATWENENEENDKKAIKNEIERKHRGKNVKYEEKNNDVPALGATR